MVVDDLYVAILHIGTPEFYVALRAIGVETVWSAPHSADGSTSEARIAAMASLDRMLLVPQNPPVK
jgi:hypothetical protein